MEHMIGPLPRLHSLLVLVTVLLAGVTGGAWVAHFSRIPVAIGAGALLGALLGAAASYLLLHDFHQRTPAHVRARSRR